MKKIKKLLSNNLKTITAFIIGGIIFGGTTAVVAAVIAANQVTYTPPSGVSANNVQTAIDELYTRASKWVNPNDMGTPTNYSFNDKPTTSSPTTPPSGKNVYVAKYADGQYGVCIKRNGTQHCFRYNNWIAEREHIQEVFSDISCDVDSSCVQCTASDFHVGACSDGQVSCRDNSTGKMLLVDSDGSVLSG